MFKYGRSSMERLEGCHPKLQSIMHEAIKTSPEDISILCGHRGEYDQTKAYNSNKSKVKYPNSMHNSTPSMAVDIAPYPIDWKNLKRFEELADLILDIADKQGVCVRWGGDWDMDGDTYDQTFNDLPHFELC